MSRYMNAEEVKQERLQGMGPELGEFYSLLADECQILFLEWVEYKTLFGTSPERIELLNETASHFFGRLQNALWEMILLRMARLLDPPNSGTSKENVTLRKLPDIVNPALKSKIDRLVGVARSHCAFTQEWRNRYIAHRDLRIAQDESGTLLPSASRSKVDVALDAIAVVLNAIESHYLNGAEVAYRYSESDSGARALLCVLRDGVEARREQERGWESGDLSPVEFKPHRPI
jgi:hypothetical protein